MHPMVKGDRFCATIAASVDKLARTLFASVQMHSPIWRTLGELADEGAAPLPPVRSLPSQTVAPRNSPTKELTMSFNHAIVWLDQTEAHVIHFTRDAAESEVIKTTSQHKKDGVVGNNRAQESTGYMDEVATALASSKEVLIVGPGQEKLAFMKHLNKHHADLADKVVSVETVDHPNDGQLLEYARKYFVKSDMMN